jgi:hypothetical protein
MLSSGMLRRVTLVRTDVSEELSASIMRMTRIGELGTMLAVIRNRRTLLLVTANVVPSSPILITLMMKELSFSEMSVHTRTTRRNIPGDSILLSQHALTAGFIKLVVTNQNLIQEEIKLRLNSGNACYHSVQDLLSSRLLSKNVKVRIYKTIILPVVLYGCETWSLTMRGT